MRHKKSKTPPNARSLALDLLKAVLEDRQPLDETWARDARILHLEARDRAFLRKLVTETLRRLGQIDALIGRFLNKPLKANQGELRQLLRLGLCQLCFLKTPPHAAVNTTVNLASGQSLAGFRGLVNAVMRRATREAEALEAEQDAARLNTPDWLWQSWTKAFGETTARAIAEAHLTDPPLDLTVKDDPQAWQENLDASLLATGSLRLPPGSGDITALPGYEDGAWWVQDAAACLPAKLLEPVAGKRVIDLCAAPGGKTAQLAAAGAEVTAVELSASRVARLQENLSRTRLEARVIEADARTWRPDQPADAVLLDAPCSATGTIRRHPDIPHLKGAGGVASLTGLQDELLKAAFEMVAPGGLLVYATCSLQKEEGPARIEALLKSGVAAERVPISASESPLADLTITPEGDLRTLPSHLAAEGGMDGFYACRLRRL